MRFRSRLTRKTVKNILGSGAIVIAGTLLFCALILTLLLAWISRDLPDPNILLSREVPLTTKIYDRTGKHLLYEIHGEENRTLIQVANLPSFIPHATVAIEDKHFYTHAGVDWRGLLRAFVKSILRLERIKGTSTLTQQFVKNAILTNERSVTRKLKELLLSLQLERVYTKAQILQLYLNEIPYGSTIYGIESAAKNYFGKAAADLTLDEAALLAAMPQAPDLYSPYGTGLHGDNRTKLTSRQHYLLDQMAAQGYIRRDQAAEAKKIETLKKLVPKKIGNISAPHFVMYIRSLLIEKYGQKMVEEKGLKVTTSLDWDKQLIAEEEVKKGVEARGKRYRFTNASLVSLDPKTGQIFAMVGSKDFFDVEHDGQVNVALRPRQPGSSFKPIVYAAGFAKGFTPETTLWDVNTIFKTDIKNYEPKNYDLKEYGPVSIRQALQGSLNIPAVKMLYLVGVSRVLDIAEELGYSTFGDRKRFGLSLVLGGGEVKLLEHTRAYATFANEGMEMPLTSILRVEDAEGKILEELEPTGGRKILEKNITHTVSNILSDNAARAFIFGEKNHLTIPGRPVAVKTGTTNNFHDAWAMGYTPSLVAGVWVGNNDNTEMKRGADGSQIAAPIWNAYVRRALEKSPVESFTPPKPMPQDLKPILLGKAVERIVKIDATTGKLATELTPPEAIVERAVREAHDTLYYLDRDDPRGPMPEDPTRDPQYTNWETAVHDWVKKTNWLTATSTLPPGFDMVSPTTSRPIVTILSPTPYQTWTSLEQTVISQVISPQRILRIEVYSEGSLIGTSQTNPETPAPADGIWTIPVRIPNSLTPGFRDLEVIAMNETADRGHAIVTINLNKDGS